MLRPIGGAEEKTSDCPALPNRRRTSFASATAGIDLRQRATSTEVNDSTAATFVMQLRDRTVADYAIVNLGAGDQWLTSRLYIMAVVFARMKGLGAFVFLGRSENGRRYLGWADPNRVRWALGRKYPWLESAYAAAYASVLTTQPVAVTSATGRVGYVYNPDDPQPSIDLLRAFLEGIQWPQQPGAALPGLLPVAPPAPGASDWVEINAQTETWEHASWVTAALLEEILGDDLHFSQVRWEMLQERRQPDQVRLVLAEHGQYVAVTENELRFRYLVDRTRLLEQVADAIQGERSGAAT